MVNGHSVEMVRKIDIDIVGSQSMEENHVMAPMFNMIDVKRDAVQSTLGQTWMTTWFVANARFL